MPFESDKEPGHEQDAVLPSGCLRPEWFEIILCSLNDGVFCVDRRGRITCFNAAAADITGVPRERALGMPCHEVFRSDICKESCALAYTMETGNPLVNLVVNIRDARGCKKPVSVSTAILRDKEGTIVGGVETFRDLSLVEQLRKQVHARYTFEDILSKSPAMRHLFDTIPVVAESDSTVLVTGESGTGKNLVARAIHHTSPRRDGPFVTINCAAVPETLLESELFGYMAGAFTDARKDKPGRVSQAEGGTLFLDEIGDIPLPLQAKLLRLLQEKVYQPLGGVEEKKADVRIVAATNRDLEKLVEEGRFRKDLYYRVNVITLHLPPLRERMEDVPLLAEHFIARLATCKGKDVSGLSPEVLEVLMHHDFPGNVRELENIIEHAFVMCPGGVLRGSHLPPHLRPASFPPPAVDLGRVARYEREVILQALAACGWNREKTAKSLGIHKTTLFRKIKKLDIPLPAKDGRSQRKKKDREETD